jgi:hypothetical protein
MTELLTMLEPAARSYYRSLLELHALSLRGLGDSPESAALCEGMEAPWVHMSEEEQERARGLSADL